MCCSYNFVSHSATWHLKRNIFVINEKTKNKPECQLTNVAILMDYWKQRRNCKNRKEKWTDRSECPIINSDKLTFVIFGINVVPSKFHSSLMPFNSISLIIPARRLANLWGGITISHDYSITVMSVALNLRKIRNLC